MCSFELNDNSDELDGGEEISCELVISGSYTTEMFDDIKETLDEVALAVEGEIAIALDQPVGFGRDDRGDVAFRKEVDQSICVVGFVGQESLRVDLIQQRFSLAEVGGLPGRQREADGIAQSIDDGVDLRGQSASGASDGLVFAVFFRAPALC